MRRAQANAGSALCTMLDARDHHAFARAIQPGDWPTLGNLLLRLFGGHHGDHRSWAEVDSWAEGIASALLVVPPQESRSPPAKESSMQAPVNIRYCNLATSAARIRRDPRRLRRGTPPAHVCQTLQLT